MKNCKKVTELAEPPRPAVVVCLQHSVGRADPDFVGPKAFTGFGTLFNKSIQNYEYKLKYEIEYLFRIKIKEITTNYKFKKADKYRRHHKILKSSNIFID